MNNDPPSCFILVFFLVCFSLFFCIKLFLQTNTGVFLKINAGRLKLKALKCNKDQQLVNMMFQKGLCISQPPTRCLAPGPGPQLIFSGLGPKFVFTGLGPQFVFTGLGLQFVFTTPDPNLYLPDLAPNQYLPALAPNLYLPVLAYNFYYQCRSWVYIYQLCPLPTLSIQFVFTNPGQRFVLLVQRMNLHIPYYWQQQQWQQGHQMPNNQMVPWVTPQILLKLKSLDAFMNKILS